MRLKGISFVILFALLAPQAYAKNDRYENEDNKHEKKHKKMHKKEKKEKTLNRGMQKRIDSGKALPPGWQKKLVVGELLDKEIYRASRIVEPVNIRGEIVIEVDQRLIRLHNATREIIDILR